MPTDPASVPAAEGTARLAFGRAGRGKPLVLLHGLGADRTVWRPVLPYLTSRREVISVDLPGFGGSPALGDETRPSPSHLASSVVGLLAQLGLEGGRAHLAGNSLGAWVALEAAAEGHAASVVAIAPAGLWSQPLGEKLQIGRWLARLAAPVAGPAMRVAPLRRAALASAVARPDRIPAAEAAALIRTYAQSAGFASVNRAMRAAVFSGLQHIPVPVTLAWPEHDRLVRRPTSAVPPWVREVTLKGCGHMPMWDDPQAVAAVLLAGAP